MVTIQEGVKIHIADNCNKQNRIWINRGTVPATRISNESYEPLALVPALNWRKPESDEAAILIENDPDPDYTSTIGVIRLPKNLVDQLTEFEISNVSSIGELSEKIQEQPDLFNQIREGFKEVIGKYSYIENGYLIHDILVNDGNRLSTTINMNNKLFTGMHIDFWDQLKLNQIDDARNRISFNLGKSPRYFLFINQTISQITDGLKQHVDISNFNQEKVLKEFFRINPDYPVTKVKVEPFEAYIAPTENLIHDGSTLGSTSKDIQLFTRGYFSIAEVSKVSDLASNQ